MYYVAAALLMLSGLFYSAGHHELGQFGADVCRHGRTFCDNPVVVFWCRAGRRLGHVRQHQVARRLATREHERVGTVASRDDLLIPAFCPTEQDRFR